MYFLLSNPIFDAYQGSDLFGKGIFLGLFILSIITWILFFQKISFQKNALNKARIMKEKFSKKCNPLTLEPKESPHPFALIFQSLKSTALELLHKNRVALDGDRQITLSTSDIDFIDAHLAMTISAESKKMEKNLFVLSTVVTLAPFLGLLGTVWGILLTFSELQQGGNVNANATIMGGLAMALGTTVLGLLVAIPALIGYNYLKSSICFFVTEMEDFSHLLLAQVELQYRQVDVYEK